MTEYRVINIKTKEDKGYYPTQQALDLYDSLGGHAKGWRVTK